MKRPTYCPFCGKKWAPFLKRKKAKKLEDGMWQCKYRDCRMISDFRAQQRQLDITRREVIESDD